MRTENYSNSSGAMSNTSANFLTSVFEIWRLSFSQLYVIPTQTNKPGISKKCLSYVISIEPVSIQ